MLEIAPEDQRGGNSAFTGGAFRVVYHGVDDLARLIPDINENELANVDFGTYTEDAVFRRYGPAHPISLRPRSDRDPDPQQLRGGAVDARAGRAVSARPRPPGVQGRRQVQVLGRARLPHLGRRQGVDQGAARPRRARRHPAPLRDAGRRPPAGDHGVAGVRVRHHGRIRDLRSKAVVLACGGFEANAEMRARYLGPNWDLAKVRGSRFNTGQGLKMALDIGAAVARPLVGRACGRLGFERAAVWRSRCRRPLSEARLPVRHRRQRQRRALSRRGPRFPQLHLRQIRRRDPEPAGHVRLAGLRPEGRPPAARRIPHPAHHQGKGRQLRGPGAAPRRRRSRPFSRHGARLQRRPAARRAVQPQHP